MIPRRRFSLLRSIAFLGVAATTMTPRVVVSQASSTPPVVNSRDSVMVAAGAHFRAGNFHRSLLGGYYRDLWITPIKAPVLDLSTFAGGIEPLKAGGGAQTASLRFRATSGTEYVFRSVDKDAVEVPPEWRGTSVERLALDQVSNSFPGSAVVATRLLDAASVLNAAPALVVMPDDTLLGEFREKFAGRLGMIEEYPSKPKHADGFRGALRVIDSDSLLQLIDRDPQAHIDARAFLTARLMDMLLNDWDRHPKQWKWAQFDSAGSAPWEPIARDRDKAFISYSGFLPGLASHVYPYLMKFDSTYGSMTGLTFNSREFDRRMLAGVERPVFDSIAHSLVMRLSDSVIDVSVAALPREYRSAVPELTNTLRLRRNGLPDVATRFYEFLAVAVNVHATDAVDRATITRVDDRHVDIELQSGALPPWYHRRFDAVDTRAIRVYLHGGSDTAVVRGNVRSSIPLWIVGGNGTNLLLDSSTVGGRRDQAELRDVGAVSGVSYGDDTLFDRRPAIHLYGKDWLPARDVGSTLAPTAGLSINRDFGIFPRLGFRRTGYGFERYPYSSLLELDARYSFKLSGFRVGLSWDKRLERSPWHFGALLRSSQLEVVNFHGYGNSSPSSADTDFFTVRHTEWLIHPAVAWAVSPHTDFSFGPFAQYAATDLGPARFVGQEQPYGVGTDGKFGEAGLRLSFHHDSRRPSRHAKTGNVLDVTGSYVPAAWDASSAFESVTVAAAQYFTLPIPSHPYLALRAGGKKLWGAFPFEDAAYIGGTTTVRTLDPNRYAGDAALYATAELRVPLANFTVMLPLNAGLLGTGDVGRVYVNGSSPGGWHNAFGAGFWIALQQLSLDVRVMRRDEVGRPAVLLVRLASSLGSSSW